MDPVAKTPTSLADYALLSGAYGSLLTALMMASRARGSEPLRDIEILPIGVATFALSKLLTKEKVETWVRGPFVEEQPDGERTPKGSGMRYAVGELLTCSRCMGAWSALSVTALRLARPREARVLTTVLAASAVNDFMQTGFSLAASHTNIAEKMESVEPEQSAPGSEPAKSAPVPVDGTPASV
jgi:hypothetical protein